MQGLVFRSFCAAWLRHLFTNKPRTKEQYAASHLFQSTFRIPESDRYKPFLVLRKYGEFLKLFLSNAGSNEFKTIATKGTVFVYDMHRKNFAWRKEFTEFFSGREVSGGVFKDKLNFAGGPANVFFLLFLNGCWLPFLFIHSVFKKDKAPIANLFREQVEALNLLKLVREHTITQLYYFCIYEKDSNITTLLLNKQNVNVCKVPSEVPLGIWNRILIADTLCVCNGYQYDEISHFKDSMFIGKTEFFGPEQALLNISKYANAVPAQKKVIGFYSTGAWVRKLENHIDQGYKMEGTEEMVKETLRDFCLAHPSYKVKLFLHPRERWDKYIETTRQRYAETFKGVEFEFCDFKKRSADAFEEADFAIAFKSTIVFERLYYGYKTILMPLGWPNFPVPGSNMSRLCATSKEDLFEKIKANVDLSNMEFFEKNGIKHFAKYLYN